MGGDPFILIVKTLGSLYLFVVVLRLLLQLSRADFYNPISQAIVKATSPVLLPLRKVIPPIGRLDTSSVVLALLVQFIMVFLIFMIANFNATPAHYVIYTVAGLLYNILQLYFWAVIITVVLSWVAPHADHPGAMVVRQVCDPLYRLCHKFLPNLGGLDLSPIFIFLSITILQQFLRPYVI
ncbi:YggT family protein [Marinomonas balearica]|uniref:YggT family protein n=1 Tax=Marinomonas balearica TaxID=491947 RepID=A0A4R6M3H4_9GAMM|nr:YggT family protein [Marinomonas balearica]TDO95546.1 YggT family protein [Marinomonas balearica]